MVCYERFHGSVCSYLIRLREIRNRWSFEDLDVSHLPCVIPWVYECNSTLESFWMISTSDSSQPKSDADATPMDGSWYFNNWRVHWSHFISWSESNIQSAHYGDLVVVPRTMLCNSAIFETMTTSKSIVIYSLLTVLTIVMITVNPNTPPEIVSN